jgi:hypothetical protein
MSDPLDDLIAKVQNGIITIDEAREELGLPAFGLPETSEPIVYTTQGPMTLARASVLVRQKTEVTSHLSPAQINALVREIRAQLLKNARRSIRPES